jgi:hypothetical protein
MTLAVEQLRVRLPAAAQMFELFAYLGGEPVPVPLRRGKTPASRPLRSMLGSTIPTNRTVRDLNRFGLAKVDALQQVQVHRLVQRVLRDSLSADLAAQTLRNTQQLLATADAGPGREPEVTREDMGPHSTGRHDQRGRPGGAAGRAQPLPLPVRPATTRTPAAGRGAARAWARTCRTNGSAPTVADPAGPGSDRQRPPDLEGREAEAIARETFERLKANPTMGPRHEYTLITGSRSGPTCASPNREALEFDQESVALHREVFGVDDNYTLRARPTWRSTTA